MLRSSDSLHLKVSYVVTESVKIETVVKVEQKKNVKRTFNITLSKNSQDVIKKYLLDRDKDSYYS